MASETTKGNAVRKEGEGSDMRAFVESTAAAGSKHEKATGTHTAPNEQNKLIDQHNLRK
ncbi:MULTISPECIES: hypothetical protein [Paenibacillus]|uniref:hypothetical protein n=1 Tax=Paenibacillus TaxID=44249 RepID=UPI0022B93BBA|nr:hypothetical protein [Paenibacillus caseinilyticus]MCZ8520425.1 hypothetical protein [Paenibacillus caseinilyticus]